MRRMHILCEGQTEETVVREVLKPYFDSDDTYVTTSILTTKRAAGEASCKGGVSGWGKVRREIHLLLRDSSISVLTTLIDYYGLSQDVPGMTTRPAGTPEQRVAHVERAIGAEIGDARFVPHLVLHEIETWVFAGAEALGELAADKHLASRISAIVAEVDGAEHVNDGVDTAPSKRMVRLFPGYRKTSDGPLVISEVGVEKIRGACPHADAWFGEIAKALGRAA